MYRITPKYKPQIYDIRTEDWLPADSHYNFEYEYKDNPDYQLYKDNPIKYHFNEADFRSDSFSLQDYGNVFLGCSHTFGVGHHIENTWAWEVHQAAGGGRFWNLGVEGGGISSGFINLTKYMGRMKIKNVFFFFPHRVRYSYFYKNKSTPKDKAYMTTATPNFSMYQKFSKKEKFIMIDDRNVNLHYEIILNAILHKCNEKNIPVYTWNNCTWEQYLYQQEGCLCNPEEYDRLNLGPHNSREGHWPVCMHEKVAKEIIRNYKLKIKPKFIPSGYKFNKLEVLIK